MPSPPQARRSCPSRCCSTASATAARRAANFFCPIATAAQATGIALAYAATLNAIDPGPIAVSRWLSTVGLVVGSAVVVRLLSARVARLVTSLERMARTDHLTGMPNLGGFPATGD